jgi:N-acetyl-gamma-glutamyl-phosphate reductase
MAYATIVGATGYSGQETLDRVLAHPELELHAVGSDTLAGRSAAELDPRLNRNGGRRVPHFVTNEAALQSGADVVFVCLDHERAALLEPPSRGVVIDLSGAHRLADPLDYETWYGFEHPKAGELERWSYALPELFPPQGRLLANPGCYATATLLALQPLREAIDPVGVVVDAKSGMTGAGRSLKASSHAGFVLENVSPYKVGRHQHAPEIAQALGFPVCFVPHLLPVRRGLIATCYVTPLDGADLRGLLEEAYADAPLVDVLPEGVEPELSRVHGNDTAEIAVYDDRATGRAVVICALDNLGKGAAGQAIQNANLAFGWAETAGLRHAGVLV